MLQLVPMTTEHVLAVFPRRREEALGYNLQETIALAHAAKLNGTALAAVDADTEETIAVGGVFDSHPGVGNCWVLGTDDMSTYASILTRLIKEKIPEIMEAGAYSRIQCDVVAHRDTWVRWAEYLGFQREGILRAFRDGKDAVALAIVKEDI